MSRLLVFNNLLDCAHGALFNAVAASDAGLFVYNLAYAVYNLDAFLGASSMQIPQPMHSSSMITG